MAMTKCDECGGDVSTKARRCVHCGTGFLPTSENSGPDWILWIWGPFFIFVFFVGCLRDVFLKQRSYLILTLTPS